MIFIEQGIETFPELDPTKLSVVENGFDGSSLARELRDPIYDPAKVTAFRQVVTETLVWASEIAQAPGASLEVGKGKTESGIRFQALTQSFPDGDNSIVYSSEYLRAVLGKDLGESEDVEEIIFFHPVVLTAHEVGHLRQFATDPNAVENDIALAAGDNNKWAQTTSDLEATKFSQQYVEALKKKISGVEGSVRRSRYALFGEL